MKHLLTHNPGLKLLAIVLAVWVWSGAANEPELAATITIPVQYRNLPKDLEIASGFVGTMMLEVRGPADHLRRVSASDTAAVLDFASVKQPGEQTFGVGPNQVALPRGVGLVRAIPAQLRFTFEQRTTRAVPVTVRFTGALPAGFKVSGFEAEPKSLEITGPASSVATVEVVETDPLDLSGVRNDIQKTVAVFAAESGVRFVSTPRVMVKVHVEKGGN